MACPLCGGADHSANGVPHAVLNCPTYVRVPQPLKDAITRLWDDNPQGTVPGDPLATWIYENIYSPGAALPGHWTHWYSRTFRDPRGVVDERVYMAARSQHLLTVWNALLPYFNANDTDVIQAKHCVPAVADMRPDSIVIYLRNKAAVWRLQTHLQALRRAGTLADTHFRNATPPGTGRLSEFIGVATARQPVDEGESFGGELSRLLGEAFDRVNRPMRIPKLAFVQACLAHMKAQGVDILAPWNRPRQVF